jgi:hypothetical protein
MLEPIGRMTKTLNLTIYAERNHLKIVKHVQYTSESRIYGFQMFYFSDTICVRLSNGKNKMADTIWKPDRIF